MQSRRGLKLGLLKKISSKSPDPQNPKQKPPTSSPSSEKGEFEKRLQFLKSLRDKKLINDDEYKTKKIELLSQFPWRHVMETASVEEVNLTNIKAKILEIEKPRNDWSTAKGTAKGTTSRWPFD